MLNRLTAAIVPLAILSYASAGCTLEMREPVFFTLDDDGAFSRFESDRQKPTWTQRIPNAISISANPCGEIAASFIESRLGLYRQSDGELISMSDAPGGSIAWSNSGDKIALVACSSPGSPPAPHRPFLTMYDRSFKQIAAFEHPPRDFLEPYMYIPLAAISWSADDRFIAVSPRGAAHSLIFDTVTSKVLPVWGGQAAFVGPRTFVATLRGWGRVEVGSWEITDEFELHELIHRYDGEVVGSWPSAEIFFAAAPSKFILSLSSRWNIYADRVGNGPGREFSWPKVDVNEIRGGIAIVPKE